MFAYRQNVLALSPGSSYRVLIAYRWYASDGTVLKRAKRRSCRAAPPGYHPAREHYREPVRKRHRPSRIGRSARGEARPPGRRTGGPRGRDDARRLALGGRRPQADRRGARATARSTPRSARTARSRSSSSRSPRIAKRHRWARLPRPARRGRAGRVDGHRLQGARHLRRGAAPARRAGRQAGDRRRRPGPAPSCSR